ncbi:hypothetical protein HYE67_005483 [Fusarium culmorum]|uniref:Uncharacterized protein n=1 Tax=Fusarium culmorum TaxID=5516 RepID=A0A2T4GFK4_FUSCU|nr:hypothetical protein FCULG_00011997 [Fusarium culmorum]QPC63252.1 hypothetical protein HYE67_005483 [Fusarium culmorum]
MSMYSQLVNDHHVKNYKRFRFDFQCPCVFYPFYTAISWGLSTWRIQKVAKAECGSQFGTGGDADAWRLSCMGRYDSSDMIRVGKRFIDNGVERVMTESEGITKVVKLGGNLSLLS